MQKQGFIARRAGAAARVIGTWLAVGWRPGAVVLLATALLAPARADDLAVTDHYADSNGVKIHYVSAGSGPLVVFIHGFPDFWYSWRHQMAGLADRFQVVAMDQRGYNLSDAPPGEAQYDMALLVADVAAVIRDAGAERATVVGHDWGGAVAWQVAFNAPQLVERLVILNLPHPRGMSRELANNPEQRANSAYARRFQEGSPDDPDILFGGPMTAENLAGWVSDEAARPRYLEAFRRSDFGAMLNYYKRNYPRQTTATASEPAPTAQRAAPQTPRLAMPVLMFHGLDDRALHSDALAYTWDWLDADLTLVTVPGAGHFVQQDAAALVTSTLRWWLLARSSGAADR